MTSPTTGRSRMLTFTTQPTKTVTFFVLVAAALVIGLIPDFLLQGEEHLSIDALAAVFTLSPLVATIGASRVIIYGFGLAEIFGIAVLFGYLPMWLFFAVRWHLAPSAFSGACVFFWSLLGCYRLLSTFWMMMSA